MLRLRNFTPRAPVIRYVYETSSTHMTEVSCEPTLSAGTGAACGAHAVAFPLQSAPTQTGRSGGACDDGLPARPSFDRQRGLLTRGSDRSDVPDGRAGTAGSTRTQCDRGDDR